MAAFSYRALNPAGKTIKGVLEGDSERQVRAQLRAQKLKPLAVRSVAQKEAEEAGARRGLLGGRRLSSKDLSLITRQLASLVQSGLPLDETLQVAARQSRKESIKGLLLQVRSRVVEGRSLAQALGEHPKAFDHMYRAMVRAGESAGFLGQILERLADYTESSQATRQRLQMAMVYPLVLLGVSVTVIGILMAFVVPDLIAIFQNSDRELPMLTKILIAVSDFVSSWRGLVALLAVIGAIAGFRFWLRDEKNRMRWHRFLLRVPVINDVLIQADSARFSATLAILLSSGVPLLEALRISGQVLGNLVLRASSMEVAAAVQEGSSLNRALDRARVFPPLLVQMVASGEANGTLSEQLNHAARNQDRELEMMLGTTLGLLEPFTVVFMGVIVTMIVMAILMPIFNINQLV
ncbi:type II secretion system inner membrane protein GspF [Gilvimarinus sp. F26214L]|uniref:type II secretion system inner membrane protein GspF n=1 Tax=Gilvimarinus sp. DZF01 TaxID=3461371 RepID=UPI00404640B6